MPETKIEEKSAMPSNRRVHMANERTFLAWIRTSIGIMAFGFVVERFALFIKEISHFLGKSGVPETRIPSLHGYSSAFGVFLVGLGAAIGALAFVRFRRIGKEIDEEVFHRSSKLPALLTIAVLAMGVFLVIYLIRST
jgi:putative membrane protein